MKIANILSILLGTVFLFLSIQWIFTPQSAAESLGMLYLEGEGRNTQIRDFTAFFLGTSIMCFLSFFTKQYQWILSAGLIYLLAAIFNILASFYHEAPITTLSLVAEILFFSIAFISAAFYKSNNL
tara:strand:+ start:1217 stop:1594 length:378 start_codon:yes stop_codon:yes gene_type:complete